MVNIILKDRIEAPEVYLHYGQADGGGMQRRAAASLDSVRDRLKTALLLDYYETGALIGEERDLWRNQDYRRFGGQDYRIRSTNPGNVYSLTGQPFDLGTNDGVNPYSAFSDWSITPPSRRTSAYGSAQYSFDAKLSFFGEVLAGNNESTALRSLPSLSQQPVPASNPFNPYGIPVAVDYLISDMEPVSHRYKTNLLRLVGGVRGAINRWEWEITGLRHREDGSSTSWGALDPVRVAAAINSEDPTAALDLFSDGPAGSAEPLNSLMGSAQRFNFSFSSAQGSAFIRGPHALAFKRRIRPAENKVEEPRTARVYHSPPEPAL